VVDPEAPPRPRRTMPPRLGRRSLSTGPGHSGSSASRASPVSGSIQRWSAAADFSSLIATGSVCVGVVVVRVWAVVSLLPLDDVPDEPVVVLDEVDDEPEDDDGVDGVDGAEVDARGGPWPAVRRPSVARREGAHRWANDARVVAAGITGLRRRRSHAAARPARGSGTIVRTRSRPISSNTLSRCDAEQTTRTPNSATRRQPSPSAVSRSLKSSIRNLPSCRFAI